MQFLDKAGVITIVNWIKNNYVNKTTVSIPSSIPSASFGSEILVGSVDGKQFKFKMPANPNVNTASLQVSDTTNKRINTSETTGNYIQFTGGTNKFTVGDGTNSFEVAVTPSITNNVTGTGTSGQAAVFNGAHTLTGRAISTSIATDNSTNLVTEGAVKSYVDGATAGLSGAMHYIGTSTSAITDGGTENPTISGYSGTAKTAGNVVVYGSKEFVWDGTAWEEFGDEGSYALKTVSVTGTGVLSGGGTLTEDRTIVHNTSGATAGTYGPGADVTGSEGATISVPEITVDEYGHITAISNKTYTSKNTTYTALKNPNALNIGTKPSTSGTATNRVTYDGSASGKGLYFSSAAASNTNVQFAVDANGFVTGTVTESVNTDRYVNSAAFASQGTNGANGTQMTLTRAGSDTQTVTATIPVATTTAAGVMSGAMVTKLNGIAAGAEVNVQSDWNATSGDAMILNKPTIPAAANDAKLQVKGSASNAAATDTGFTANASSAGVITFKVGATGNTISSITTSGGTVTINGASIEIDEAIPDSELQAILYPSN